MKKDLNLNRLVNKVFGKNQIIIIFVFHFKMKLYLMKFIVFKKYSLLFIGQQEFFVNINRDEDVYIGVLLNYYLIY